MAAGYHVLRMGTSRCGLPKATFSVLLPEGIRVELKDSLRF